MRFEVLTKSTLRSLVTGISVVLVIPLIECPLAAQQGCQQPAISVVTAGPNIFTDDQEIDLGDAIAQQTEQYLRVTDDPQVTAYLARIGGRLEKELPPSHLRFRYYLVDLAAPNAFAIAGGRIYVSRKLVAFVKSEDELAGILAHEMGHVVTHQSAVEVSYLLSSVLGVTQVGDRRDVFAKFAELATNWRRNPQSFRKLSKQGEGHQHAADQVGLQAMAAAGYNPQAAVDAFDRVTELGGKTGGWLSDFLRTTPPDARRLREIIKGAASLSEACVKEHAAGSGSEFQAWQAAVIQYTGWKRREMLEGVVSKVQLEPLRAQLTHVRFSPDGHYILAQDIDKIYVLSREPLATLFAIDAEGARPAQFTPDSKSVVWFNSHLHVESWDIQAQKRESVYEPVVAKGCSRDLLAPDGKTVACLDGDSTLRLLDVASGSVVIEKRKFRGALVSFGTSFFMGSLGLGFSPDGRYFLAGNMGQALAFDVQERSELPVQGDVRKVLLGAFVFVGSDRLFGWDSDTPFQADLVSFPAGKMQSHLRMRPFAFTTVTRGNFVLLNNLSDDSVGVLDLGTMKATKSFKRRGVDICDSVFAEELANGELGLYDTKSSSLLARVKLPGGDLTLPTSASVDRDLNWLALAEKERGTVWNLSTGKVLYLVRQFNGAYLDRDYFYGDFPKHGETKRAIARFELNRESAPGVMNVEDEFAHQHGRYLVVTKPAKPVTYSFGVGRGAVYSEQFDRDVTREIRDAVSGRTLWTRHFPKEAPALAVEPSDGTMTLTWRASMDAAEEEARQFPKVQSELAATMEKKWVAFVEVVEAWTGKPLGAFLLDTNKGSIVVIDQFAVGDWLLITDAQGQVLVYSISSGEKLGGVLGTVPEVSKASGLLCVRSDADQLGLYDLASMTLLREYTFSSPVVFKQFSQDGKRLLVVTADQAAYQLDVVSAREFEVAGAVEPEPPAPRN